MDTNPKILLAEDDEHLSHLIKDELEDEGYSVTLCADGQSAIDVFDKNKFDLCLLDIMMPVKDGFTVAKKIRQQSDVIPIIFISTRALIDDKIEGYSRGADDYIVKPFNMRELLLKLDVFLRRTRKLFSEVKSEFTIGKIFFSHTDLKFESPDGVLKLKQKEADLLQFLCMHPNKILKRDEILLAVWGKDDYFLGRSMDVFMSKLRKYLKADPQVVLETIHGLGYRFSVPA
ncbi:MAG TPA: response regulator transcription factor [Chitinophagaceae bacterium]|jgi:DNA-binding response OmpR family regulator|nr:response regulator transcription factor [Chitinophagaceae bacterium]HND95612.1 response regulator transcription factor [Chitinophagaceae bacterium]HNJ55127.1 response regulator transcription factor [Chitinophagaceae bacterium]HNL59098.1 response regulator transcription factor [Chitinophagaceae bacterium]HNO00829.1 response regulator transcription factor [Chitinophagaceae bacterium]